jgi:hypothetical protein
VEDGKKINGQPPAVLCLIDFSEASRQALKWAADEAWKQHTQLTVLYPYRLNHLQGRDGLGKVREGLDTQAVFNFQKLAEETLDGIPIEYEFKPEIGFITDRVYAHSHIKEFSMLVISKHLAIHNKEYMMELIDLIKFPLVIVPQTTPLTIQS